MNIREKIFCSLQKLYLYLQPQTPNAANAKANAKATVSTVISRATNRFLTDYLVEKLEPTFPAGYGEGDERAKPIKVASLEEMFERYIYSTEGARGDFLMSESGIVYVYNGRWYEKVTTESYMEVLVKSVLSQLGVGLVYQKYSAKKIADSCLKGMENDEGSVFKANRRYIAFDNGVFDVKTGEMLPFSREYKTDLVMGIEYDASARYPLWDEKLMQIIPSEGMRDALQIFCGMLLGNRAELKFEYACFIVGPGSNGKSVIAAAIANVFGSEHFGKFEPRQFLKATNSEYAMAALDGMIANFTDDLSKDDISGGMFKKFVSGEEFPARHPYGRHHFNVKAPLMLCCCNAIPPTTDDSWGHHRRILPIVSTDRIWKDGDKGRDASLDVKLSVPEARQAIFNWIYEGYRRYVSSDGNIPFDTEVVEKQKELMDDSNSARRWIRDMGFVAVTPEPRDARWKWMDDWYKDYKAYCEEGDGARPQTKKSLKALFKEKGFAMSHRANGDWFCIGVEEVKESETEQWLNEGKPAEVPYITDDELPF